MPEKTFAEAAGLPEMNVEYTYAMVSNSNVKAICIALKKLRTSKGVTTELPENPGHSVTLDILNCLKDIAVAEGYTVPAKAYANDVEGIADVIEIMAAGNSDETDATES